MAFSFKLPKMTGVGNGGSSAPMTLSADAPSGKTQLPGFLWQVFASLSVLVRRPRASFAHVHEPVAHGAVLRLLQALRLPLWLVLLAVLMLIEAVRVIAGWHVQSPPPETPATVAA